MRAVAATAILALVTVFELLLGLPRLLATDGPAETTTESAPGVAPSFRDVLSLRRVAYPVLSPDGRSVVFSRSRTEWKSNRVDAELWLKAPGREAFQLTRTPKGRSYSAAWSPDGRWIAFLAERPGFDDAQIQIISPLGGEARPLTRVDGGVVAFQWRSDGKSMVVKITDRLKERFKSRRKSLGRFELETDPQDRARHLWLLNVEAAREEDQGAALTPKPSSPKPSSPKDDDASADGETPQDLATPQDPGAETAPPKLWRRLTHGPWTVGEFDISPAGDRVVFSHRPQPGAGSWGRGDLSILTLDDEDRQDSDAAPRPLVHRVGLETSPRFSPDGKRVAFVTSDGEAKFYGNSYVAVVHVDDGAIETLTGDLDGLPRLVAWTETGVFYRHWQRTAQPLFRLDPDQGTVSTLEHLPAVVWDAHVSTDGQTLTAYAQGPDQLAEIWRCPVRTGPCERLTHAGEQIESWNLGSRQTVSWQSRDGLEVEGVLYRPDDFDPSRKIPLLVVIHGGPVTASFPDAVPNSVYPLLQWLNKGAMILMPNYRGSDGYGGELRAANRDLLGQGDAWDVLSGVDYLIDQGWVDADRMGVMGWSQGGYISAYLATTSDRFKGVSVGAGISDWTIYYTNTDLRQFTVDYLSEPPWQAPEAYDQASPLSFIRQAKTPTLIQHGDNDRRVPTANALALFRGLQDVGVQTELILYQNTGHGIRRPKERLAATLHNWHWFLHTVWGEPLIWPDSD